MTEETARRFTRDEMEDKSGGRKLAEGSGTQGTESYTFGSFGCSCSFTQY